MNFCNHFRRDTETCKLDGNACPYDEDWEECSKLNRKKSNMRIKGISDAGLARVSRRVSQEELVEQEVSWDDKAQTVWRAFMDYEKDMDNAFFAPVGTAQDWLEGFMDQYDKFRSDVRDSFYKAYGPVMENVLDDIGNNGVEVTPEVKSFVESMREEYVSYIFSELNSGISTMIKNIDMDDFKDKLESGVADMIAGKRV